MERVKIVGMGVKELQEVVEARKRLKEREFWEEVVGELTDEEAYVLFEVLRKRVMKGLRLRKWIRSRVEREPRLKFEQIAREIEKIFKLPLSYDPELRKEVWREFRRNKERIRVKRFRERMKGEQIAE